MSSEASVGGLVVCATPIGNLADITLRVLNVLARADVLACEDTRHSRILLAHHGIRPAELLSYHEHNEPGRTTELIERMRAGARVALLSDAGMPLICDPGFHLVRASIEASLPVQVLPGASSPLCALVLSGLPVERFRFVGFLPRRRSELEHVLTRTAETLVAFESPRRLGSTLALLAEHDSTRVVAVCRELTKRHEEVRRGAAGELAGHYGRQPPRGEVVLVVGQAPAQAAAIHDAVAALRGLVAAGARARPAAAAVGKLTGLSANELYRELTR
ncbi:MAG TPA: 16S rRNA (cytidine(1402)-2'-O)-methyltransferase [Solirubrobacteraceae bacterium]